jgi:hypothetical protein
VSLPSACLTSKNADDNSTVNALLDVADGFSPPNSHAQLYRIRTNFVSRTCTGLIPYSDARAWAFGNLLCSDGFAWAKMMQAANFWDLV